MTKDKKFIKDVLYNLLQKTNAEIEDLDDLTIPEFKALSEYEQGLRMGRYESITKVLEQIKRLIMDLDLCDDTNSQDIF